VTLAQPSKFTVLRRVQVASGEMERRLVHASSLKSHNLVHLANEEMSTNNSKPRRYNSLSRGHEPRGEMSVMPTHSPKCKFLRRVQLASGEMERRLLQPEVTQPST
jgi:hypothetical protein